MLPQKDIDAFVDIALQFEDMSIDDVREGAARLRAKFAVDMHPVVGAIVLTALADSPVLTQQERMDLFVAFAAGIGMDADTVVACINDHNQRLSEIGGA